MLAIFIFTLFSVTVVYLSLDTADRATQVEVKNEALLYAEEGMEAVRNIRDRDYLDLVSGSYGLSFSSDTWSLVAAPETIDAYYQRTVLIEDVYRDGSNNIAAEGTLDPETKRVTVTVTWNWKGVLPKDTVLSTYLTNWTGDEWMQTVCTDFSAGTYTDTFADATVSPPANNCALELSLVEGQSPFFSSVDVGDHGRDVVYDNNYAYLVTGKSNEGLVIADVTNPASPTVVKKLDIGGKGRYIVKDGNYLYIGVESNSKGLAIVNVTNPASASLTSQYNLGGYGNQAVVSGNTLFIGVEKSSNSFVALNITNKASPSVLNTYNPGSETRAVHLYGNYALIGVNNATSGFRVVDVTTPSAMVYKTSLNVSAAVTAIEVNSSVAYVGNANSSNSLKVVNLNNPLAPTVATTLNVGAKVQDIKVEGSYLYVPTDQTNNSLAVINVSTPLSPVISYFADLTGKGTGVDTSADNVYISLDTNNKGLVMVETVNVELASPGYFVSSVFDTGSTDTRYNFIEWSATVPLTGSVSFKIRTADSIPNLSSATWVGSDGTSGTSYTVSPTVIVLDPMRTGNRYAQVQITLTSDGVSTPSIESFSLNYNP